jgi:hypothetical protein
MGNISGNRRKNRRNGRKSGTQPVITNILQFALSVLVSGGTYMSAVTQLAHNCIMPPSESSFYRAQRTVFSIIEEMALESMRTLKLALPRGSILSIDGSWAHRRNSKQCVVTLCDGSHQKIVDVEILEMPARGVKSNFIGSSKNMEQEGVRRMISRWLNDSLLAGYVHDQDATTRKVMTELIPTAIEYLDKNHLMKSNEKRFTKFNAKNLLTGLKIHLQKWMFTLLKMKLPVIQKVELWLGAFDHYVNLNLTVTKRFLWTKRNNSESLSALRAFLNATKYIIQKCNPEYSTQFNEAFNALKSHFANKLFHWQTSFRTRIFAAILQSNWVHMWVFELGRRLGLPCLPERIFSFLTFIIWKRKRSNAHRRRPEVQAAEAARRRTKNNAIAAINGQAHGYGE